MFRFLLALLALTTVVAATPSTAADAPKPLRILVYDVTYDSSTLRHEHTSGFTSTPSGTMGSVAGSGNVDRRFGSDDRGRLTVEVVAATGDGGLVADVSFAGKSISQSTMRVAILKDGLLSHDPKQALSPEAIGVLPFLARGFIAERNINPAATWDVAPPAPATGATTFRVLAVEGERATIAFDAAITVKGASGFAETKQGKTVYATDVLSPITLELHSTVRRDISTDQTDTIDSRLAATLVSDTFSKRG